MFSNVDSKTATTMSLSILVGEYGLDVSWLDTSIVRELTVDTSIQLWRCLTPVTR